MDPTRRQLDATRVTAFDVNMAPIWRTAGAIPTLPYAGSHINVFVFLKFGARPIPFFFLHIGTGDFKVHGFLVSGPLGTAVCSTKGILA